MDRLFVLSLVAGLSLSSQAATYHISSSPSSQVERVEQSYPMMGAGRLEVRLPPVDSGPLELLPTRGRAPSLNDLQLRLGDYPGEQNPYVLPANTMWPYPMSSPTHDGYYNLPGGQW